MILTIIITIIIGYLIGTIKKFDDLVLTIIVAAIIYLLLN